MRPQAVGNSGRKRKSGPGIPAMSRCIIRSFRAEIFVCRPGDRSGDGSICGVVFFRFGDEYGDAVAASVRAGAHSRHRCPQCGCLRPCGRMSRSCVRSRFRLAAGFQFVRSRRCLAQQPLQESVVLPFEQPALQEQVEQCTDGRRSCLVDPLVPDATVHLLLAGGDADAADPQRTDVGLYGFGAACFPQEDVAGDIVALRHRIAEQLSRASACLHFRAMNRASGCMCRVGAGRA